jgi:hypothetical protein
MCINQSDHREKSSQVSMMGDIYRQAQQVVVSLEEPDEASEAAMSLLHKATTAIYHAEMGQQWPDMSEIIRASGVQRNQWINLLEFFQRRWFSRIWIVQEVLLGRRPVVVCGQCAVPFGALAEACARIMTHSHAFSTLLSEENLAAGSLLDIIVLPSVSTGFLSIYRPPATLRRDERFDSGRVKFPT